MEPDARSTDPASGGRAGGGHAGLVIEIVGPAGVGKSSVVPPVVAELRKRFGDSRVVLLSPDRKDSDVGRSGRLAALLAAPGLLVAAARMPSAAKAGRLSAWRRWLTVLATMHAARARLHRGAHVCVVEQGPVHYLRETRELERLPGFALPELVLEITGHPATVLERRLTRDKPRRKAELLRGEARLAQAVRLASRLADTPEGRARDLLAAWSQAFCAPPLDTEELDTTFDRGRNLTPREHPDDHWSRVTIRAPLREIVTWETIANERGTDLDTVVSRATDAVVRFVATRA